MSTTRIVELDQIGGVTVARVRRPRLIDVDDCEQFRAELDELADSNPWRVLVSLAGVELFASTALGALIRLHRRITERSGECRVCGIVPAIFEVFTITRLDRILGASQDTEVEALALFSDGSKS